MASRPSRASSIPIPMPPSNTRSLDNAISIPTSRARIPPSSFAASPPPLARSVPRSSSSLTRASARQPYEPRVVRAPVFPSEFCPPHLSSSHGRRASTSVYPGRTVPRVSLSTPPEPPVLVVAAETFPRPAYLDHSTFRDALRTEPLFATPRMDAAAPAQTTAASYSAASAMSFSTDSEEDVSPPPRRIQPTSSTTLAQQQHGVFILPTKWSDTDRSNHLTVSQDRRDLTYTGSGDKDGASARTDVPIPPACGIYYYEVEIRGKEQKSHISIGFAGPKVKFNRLPGWEASSWGYHGDDGFSFSTQRNGTPYAQTYGNGDTIGCGVDFSTHRAFYTKNGHFLGSVFENVGLGVDLYPSVGLQHLGESIRVNFGQESFKFDIENHVQQQKTAAWNKIMTTPLYTSVLNPGGSASSPKAALSDEESKIVLNKLVLSYLIHHGYPKSVQAFQKQQDIVLKSKSISTDDKDVEMDGFTAKGAFSEASLEDDIERRTRVVNAVARGDIDLAISETEKHHPLVLKAEASLMLFKLRCRKFVELILETAAMKKEIKMTKERQQSGLEGPALTRLSPTTTSPAAEGDWLEESMDMDVDDDGGYDLLAPTPSSGRSKSFFSNADPDAIRAGKQRADGDLVSTAQYEAALNAAIAYGQSLSNDYKSDTRPEVKQLFKQTFGIVAWEDPLGTGGDIAKFASVEARVQLAHELNQAILKSEGRPAQPALETLYRHTSACVTQLGAVGEGAAAFADLQRELLEA